MCVCVCENRGRQLHFTWSYSRSPASQLAGKLASDVEACESVSSSACSEPVVASRQSPVASRQLQLHLKRSGGALFTPLPAADSDTPLRCTCAQVYSPRAGKADSPAARHSCVACQLVDVGMEFLAGQSMQISAWRDDGDEHCEWQRTCCRSGALLRSNLTQITWTARRAQ